MCYICLTSAFHNDKGLQICKLNSYRHHHHCHKTNHRTSLKFARSEVMSEHNQSWSKRRVDGSLRRGDVSRCILWTAQSISNMNILSTLPILVSSCGPFGSLRSIDRDMISKIKARLTSQPPSCCWHIEFPSLLWCLSGTYGVMAAIYNFTG